MATNDGFATPKSGEEYYALDRNATETARLNTQHEVFKKSLGFLIHPSIPTTNPNLRIADFATGTGIWLTDVAKLVPPTCTLIGFDISSAQFPPAAGLPKNISFHEHDVLESLPESYHGTFDIIALRALITVLADDEWKKVVLNLIPLLKPGGWLQWVDVPMTLDSFKAVQAQACAPRDHLVRGIGAVNQWASLLGKTLNGCQRLPEIYRAIGLDCVQHDFISIDNDPSTRGEFGLEICTGLKAICGRFAKMEGSCMTVEEAVALGDGMFREIEGGKVYWRADVDVVVGRKPGL